MEIKATAREKMEMRMFIKDTMNDLMEMVRQTQPAQYLPSGKDASTLDATRMTQRNADWLDHSDLLIGKVWKLGELIGEDAVKLMEDVIAERKSPPQS